MTRTNHSAVNGHRPAARRLLDLWGFVPGFASAHHDVSFRTRDGVRLAATYLPGPGTRAPGVVLVPGFAAHRRKPAYAYLADRLATRAGVLVVDLRGHGASAGQCSLGDREVYDVRAAAAWLRRRGHAWVGVIGVSMGGTAAVRAAGTGPPGGVDAVCAISAPAVWELVDTPAMRVLTALVTRARWRNLARPLLRVRIAAQWSKPRQPVDVVAAIAPTPILFVHGEDDHFYGPEQARLLYEAADEPRQLWLEPAGFGHAEDGFSEAFVERLSTAVAMVHGDGRWPTRSALRTGPARAGTAR